MAFKLKGFSYPGASPIKQKGMLDKIKNKVKDLFKSRRSHNYKQGGFVGAIDEKGNKLPEQLNR